MPSRRSSRFEAWDRLATRSWSDRSRDGGPSRVILVPRGLSLMPHVTKLLICDVADGGNPHMTKTTAAILGFQYRAEVSCIDFFDAPKRLGQVALSHRY